MVEIGDPKFGVTRLSCLRSEFLHPLVEARGLMRSSLEALSHHLTCAGPRLTPLVPYHSCSRPSYKLKKPYFVGRLSAARLLRAARVPGSDGLSGACESAPSFISSPVCCYTSSFHSVLFSLILTHRLRDLSVNPPTSPYAHLRCPNHSPTAT